MNKKIILYGSTLITLIVFAVSTYFRTLGGFWSATEWIIVNDISRYVLFGLISGTVISAIVELKKKK